MSRSPMVPPPRHIDAPPPARPDDGRYQAFIAEWKRGLVQIALPEVIRFANAELPADYDPKQAAAMIAATAFDIADACVVEMQRRSEGVRE